MLSFGMQGKTSLIFIGVFLIIILPANTFIYKEIKSLLAESDTRELVAEGERLFSQVRIDPQIVPLPSLGYSIYLRAGNHFQIDSVFASPDFPDVPDELLFQPVAEIDSFKIATLSRQLEYASSQIHFSIARRNDRLNSHTQNLKAYLFAANIASIIIAGLLVYAASGFILRPMKKIIQASQQINASKSIQRVPVPAAFDENRQLALAINEMLSRIENTIVNQTNFFASAAHELKTPLAVMHSELAIAFQNEEHPDTRQLLQNQLDEVERLNRVVQEFLLISQLKTETLNIRKTLGRLDEVIYAAMGRVKYLVKDSKKQIRILFDEIETIPEIEFDFDKMETVISNLLENAVRYSKPNSVIVVRLANKSSRFELSIENQVSVTVIQPDTLLQEFKQVNELSTGLGLGLWICNKLIAMHDGQLKLQTNDTSFKAIVLI